MLTTQKSRTTLALLTGLMLSPVLPAVGYAAQSKVEAQTAPSIIAFNQALKNDQVTVKYAYLPADGFLEVFGATGNGSRGDKPIGRIELKAGDHRDVAVKVDSAPPKGSSLWIGLADNNGQQWRQTLPAANRVEIQ